MMRLLHLSTVVFGLLTYIAWGDTKDQVGANVNYGTFQAPSARVRPRFRYWLPDPSVDVATVKANIKSAGAIGAGGVEFLAFFNYGGQIGGVPPETDWSTYNFGTPAFQTIFRAALEAHKENGMFMDFALGPNQGQGVPAQTDDEGLQWDLVPFSVAVPSNGSYNGLVPGWGTGTFVALVSTLVLSESANISIPPSLTAPPGTYRILVLKHDTLEDLTRKVSLSGRVTLSFPLAANRTGYRLFAYYQKLSGNKNLQYSNNQSKSIFDNGSYIVDHYSARGAQVVTKFWEERILTNGVKELLMEAGNYGWEDSPEMVSNISWTPSIPSRFVKKLGYSVMKYLPLIQFSNNNLNFQRTSPGPLQCILDTPDQGAGFVNDFRSVLADGYREYLQALTTWTNKYLGLQFSTQPSYNLPMDMEASIPYVNAPECESFQFSNNIDGYRQFSGVANVAGKRVISNEVGAEIAQAYRYQISQLLWSINRAFAGGVNQIILHGQSYTGNYYGTTWPGYTAFSYLFSESYSDKQPAWGHGFPEVLNYIARMEYTQQHGVPKTDVAIYNKQSTTNFSFPTLYNTTDLLDEGWTYTYLSPENFNLPQAYVRNGILAPDGPAYKALVITDDQNLTLDAVKRLQTYPDSGLPVILSGGDPGYYPSKDASSKRAVENALSSLKNSKNVYSVGTGQVASKLASLGLIPNVKVQSNGTWYTTWREDAATGVDYAIVYSDLVASQGQVQVHSTKIPYFFNAWTGEQHSVLNYQTDNATTTIPLSLGGNQTIIIAFTSKPPAGISTSSFHMTQLPSNVLGYKYDSFNGLRLRVSSPPPNSSIQPLVLSTGKSYPSLITSPIPERFQLSSWTLIAEHWEAPSNLSDASVIAMKRNTTHHLPSLVSWTEVPGLTNVSGLGYYSTSFSWLPSSTYTNSSLGAYITLPKIQHTIRLYINGHFVPLDYTFPTADIGSYLRDGENEVLAIVPTTMWNYIRSIFSEIQNAGLPPLLALAVASLGELPGPEQNGLVGEVSLVPYVNVTIQG